MSSDDTIKALLAQNAELMRMMSSVVARPVEKAPAPTASSELTVRELAKNYYRGEGHTLDSKNAISSRTEDVLTTEISHEGELVRFGDLPANAVDKIVLASYRDARRKAKTRYGTPPRPGTRNREVALIRRWRCWGHTEGYPCKPLHNVFMEKEDNVKKGKIATDEVLNRLLNACDQVGAPGVMRALVLTLVHTGLRIGEARDLRWDGFDHQTGRLSLLGEDTKNDTPRVTKLSPEALAAVLALPRTCEYVFASKKHKTKYSERHVGQMFDDAIAAAKIYGPKGEKITLHALRHSFVYMARKDWGLSRAVIKAMTGHRTDSAFNRYGIVDEEEVDDGFDKRDELLASRRFGPQSIRPSVIPLRAETSSK